MKQWLLLVAGVLATIGGGCAEGSGYVESACSAPTPPCGNGVIDANEECDPGDGAQGVPMALGENSCESVLQMQGNLSCDCNCRINFDQCVDQGVAGSGN